MTQSTFLTVIDRSDIDALIEDAGDQLEHVRELYEDSLREQEVPARLRTRIKNVVENQRSALEYLAHAIYEAYGDGKGRRSYFPIAKASSDFPGLFERMLPGVAANCPPVRNAIEARQPYQPGFEWLQHLSLLTNENKHRRLTPQTRTEQRTTRFESGGAAIELGEGASIQLGGGADIILGGQSIRQIQPTRTVYVDWLFDDPPLSALGTLQRIQESLPGLVDDVIAALP